MPISRIRSIATVCVLALNFSIDVCAPLPSAAQDTVALGVTGSGLTSAPLDPTDTAQPAVSTAVGSASLDETKRSLGAPPYLIHCELPIVDAPFNFGWSNARFSAPSMSQALSMSKCAYLLGHKGVTALLQRRPFWNSLGIVAFDLMMPGRPLGTAWMHEEWHRAVLSARGISSYNEVYDFKGFSGILRVSHVKDRDLAELKRKHNPDLVRLSAAGAESSFEFNLAVQKDAFFRNSESATFLYWLNDVGAVYYLFSATSNVPDKIEEEAEKERTEAEKDFVGHDFTGWVYDLFRPHESYEARGVHPHGAGIERYISRSDLTTQEQKYLRTQAYLSLLNFADPFLFGKTDFVLETAGKPLYWNASLRHHLTSFGNSIQLNLFGKRGARNAFVGLHLYQNWMRPFPGVEAQLIDVDLGDDWYVTPRAILWEQPARQAFRTKAGETGGLLSARVSKRMWGPVRPYLEVGAKTAGWVAGDPFLDANVSSRLGFEATF